MERFLLLSLTIFVMIAVYTQHDRIIVSVLTAWAEMLHENTGKGYHHVLRIRDSTSVVYVAGTEPGVPATFYAIFHASVRTYRMPFYTKFQRRILVGRYLPGYVPLITAKAQRGQNVIKQKQRNDSKDL